MADISNSLNKFKTAANGEDVRDAFVETMELVNEDNILIKQTETTIQAKQAAADVVNAELSAALSGAQTNANAAAASASSATTSANQAAAYAGQAQIAAETVQSKVDAATAAENQAAESATEAAGSATTATTKAAEAAGSAATAQAAATEATTKAGEANQAATAAAESATEAAGSATTATTKAAEAAGSAATAQAAATEATTKAGEAENSASAAAASAADAELVAGVTAEKIDFWDAKEDAANKGTAGGYAALDENGKVPETQLPPIGGLGDMEKTVYDADENGIVDNAEKVNGHTVESDVPASADFTDTTYTAAEMLTEIKTVDGSGSGLDADLLDGKDATEFAPASHGLHVTFGTNVAALESGVEGITGVAETVPRSDHTHTLPPYPDLGGHAADTDIHVTAEKQAAWDRLKNLLRPSYLEAGGGVYLMFDGVDFTNGAQLSFVVPSNTYGDPLMINNSVSMLVTTKYLYKQNTTEYPILTRGEAVTAWYDLTNDCFYLKAGSTAGDTTDISLKIEKLEGQQLIDRREILDIKLKLDEINVVEFLNKTGIGFFDLFKDTSNIDSGNTTTITTDTDVNFSGEKILQMIPQTFEDFTNVELAIYDMEREEFNVDVEVDNSSTINMSITPGSRITGEKFWYNGEIYTITGVTEL